jgi:hypothetical protein
VIPLLSFNTPDETNYSGKAVIQLTHTEEKRLVYVTYLWNGHTGTTPAVFGHLTVRKSSLIHIYIRWYIAIGVEM